MTDFLFALENTALSQWVLGSINGYPIVLSFHSLGLGLLVGLLTIIALRILGVMPEQPLAPLRKFLPWVWIAFIVNAVSGVILFMADANKNFHSATFWIKMLAVAVGMAFAVHVGRTVLRDTAPAEPSPGTRTFAVVSLIAWTGAIVAGRLIAYVTYNA